MLSFKSDRPNVLRIVCLYIGISTNGGDPKIDGLQWNPFNMDDLDDLGTPTILGNLHMYVS